MSNICNGSGDGYCKSTDGICDKAKEAAESIKGDEVTDVFLGKANFDDALFDSCNLTDEQCQIVDIATSLDKDLPISTPKKKKDKADTEVDKLAQLFESATNSPKLSIVSNFEEVGHENREELDTENEFELDDISIDESFDSAEDLDILSRCPREIVLKILGQLSLKDLVHNVSLVSKTWHSMAHDSALWSSIDFRKYVTNDNVLRKLMERSTNISCIELPDHAQMTNDGMIALAKGCPNLKVFYAPRCGDKFSDDAMVAFAENCPELRELRLDCLGISDVTLRSIGRNLVKLEYLSICQVRPITNEGVADVIKSCRNLRELLANQNSQITEHCFCTFSQSSKSLRRLEMMMCNINPSGVPMIAELANLDSLNLTRCSQLEAEDLLPVLENCQKLQIISLNLDKRIDDRCVDLIFTHLPYLRMIYLVSTIITDEALHIMGRKGKSLVRIDIGYTKVTAAGARFVSETCSTLQHLGLMRCDSIPESAVEELMEDYPHITYSTFAQDAKRLIKKVDDEIEAEKAAAAAAAAAAEAQS